MRPGIGIAAASLLLLGCASPDPPLGSSVQADGTAPVSVVGSHAGSPGIPVATGPLGCFTSSLNLHIGESCVLGPFTTNFPNYTNPTITDSSGIVWLAYYVNPAKMTVCYPSGLQCSVTFPDAGTP